MHGSVLEKSSPCYLIVEAHNKPQSGFQRVLADNSYNQFKHLMLPQKFGGDCENVHPYKHEIEELLKNLKTEFVDLFDGEVTLIEDTECVWVETTSQLEDLCEILSRERVFGVDTEQHGFRSFLGFTALIQISTTSKDYLVDAIALHDVMGILRPVFANPRICKVFHGARNDILWLQRDFHIYVVNLFDTAQASYVLWKQEKSFVYLLEKYCKAPKNKAMQREDWRPRPLSAEMVEYARTDSHYLLPVASFLVSELKNDSIDLVLETIRRSNLLCLRLYKKGPEEAYLGEPAAESIISRYLKNRGSFHYNVCDTKLRCCCLSKFQRIVRRLCGWREIMARVHDESLSFILSDEAVGVIAATSVTTKKDVLDVICTADNSMSPSSSVVCGHFEEFGKLMFLDSDTGEDDFGHTILQRHLGTHCPLSEYNNNLLSDAIPKLSNRPVSNPNRSRISNMQASTKRPRFRVIARDGRLLKCCKLNEVENTKNLCVGCGEPKGNHEVENTKNLCAGCGEEKDLSIYRVIPSCYLRWFPMHLKPLCKETHLLCIDCHVIVQVAARECMRQIAKETGIPLNPSMQPVGVAARNLLHSGSKMPPNRVEELTKIVSMYYGGREITNEDLKEAALVGLSPKIQRKKGLTLSHSSGQALGLSLNEDKDKVDDHGISATSKNPRDQVTNKASSSDFGASNSESKCPSNCYKQVVEYILKESGEDGILQFSWRWKQVFTKAFHMA